MSKTGDFTKMSISVPTEYYELLQKLSVERKLPMSRFIWYALDNELEASNAFEYACPPPTTTFVQYSYTEESQKIYQLLVRFTEGLTIDMIMLMRRSIGIPNKISLMLGLRELLATKLAVESRTPPKGKFFKDLDPNLTWIRLTRDTLEHVEKNRKALEAKKAKLDAKLDALDYKESLLKPTEG